MKKMVMRFLGHVESASGGNTIYDSTRKYPLISGEFTDEFQKFLKEKYDMTFVGTVVHDFERDKEGNWIEY